MTFVITSPHSTRRLTPWLLAAIAACCWSSSALARAEPKAAEYPPAADPRLDMIRALQAGGPHPSLGDHARLFDRFVGTWDCDYAFYAENGTVSHFPGELIFGWVLDGHAVQDIWITYPREEGKERTVGTSVRYYDAASATWRVVFIAPAADAIVRMTGGPTTDDRIVLLGQDTDGSQVRWSFNEIRADSFIWRGEVSRDGGKTWWMQEEHHMKRRAGAGGAVPSGTSSWFQATEQALMSSLASGDRTVWDRVMDPSCVVTTEEGEMIGKDRFLGELRPLPEGLKGTIAVRELTVQEFPDFAVVRFLADESESVFGQPLRVQYRVTDAYRRGGPAWKMIASHLSVVTRDPPAQEVSKALWPALAGRYRLLPDGWTFTVEVRDGELLGGRDPKKLKRLVPLAPDAFVLQGSLGEWIFVVENGRAKRLVNLRKFAPLVWTREAPGS